MKKISPVLLFLGILCFSACDKTKKDTEIPDLYTDNYYINAFGYAIINTNYLWNKEVEYALSLWNIDKDDPVERVRQVRYKGPDGKDIDKWTQMLPNISTLTQSVAGTSTTFGYSLSFHRVKGSDTEVVASVRYTSKDSPAAKAGLKRGDVITAVNGKTLTTDNYASLAKERLYGSDTITLTMVDGHNVTMDPVTMYEEPVLLTKTFQYGGRKVGYLVYNSFTLGSYTSLIGAANYFIQEGIDDLILDLRYNSGGYAKMEETLASMLAPKEVVNKGEVLHKEIYNSNIGNTETRFTTSFSFTENGKTTTYNTKECNMGVKRLYAIVTGSSASASESLLCGLIPYMDVTLVGSRTLGKFCGGMMISAEYWYEYNKSKLDSIDPEIFKGAQNHWGDWGIYIMTNRYADKNGTTLSMPDGMETDVAVEDNPLDGYQLGDSRETMLHAALAAAGYDPALNRNSTTASRPTVQVGEELEYEKPGFGLMLTEPNLQEGPVSLK